MMKKVKINCGADGKKIKEKRLEQKKSRLKLSETTDVGYNIIYRAEEYGMDMYCSDLKKIAEELNTSVSELMMPTVVTVA